MESSKCIFCNLSAKLPVKQKTFYEDDICFVIKDLHPQREIHYLIIPREHLVSVVATTPKDNIIIAYLLLEVLPKIVKKLKLNDYVITVNNGAFQEISHLHIHLTSGKLLAK